MARRNNNEPIIVPARYFTWRLSKRNEYWQAVGRSNQPNAGRHSLGTKNRDEAMQLVHDLDVKIAVDFGIANRSQLKNVGRSMLGIPDGISIFEKHIARPEVAGGPKLSTRKRYGRIIRAFQKFADSNRVKFWNQVDASTLNDFAALRSEICTHATVVTEVSFIKSMHCHLIEERHLEPDCAFSYEVRRPRQTTKYCPTSDEVVAILEILASKAGLKWLHDIVLK